MKNLNAEEIKQGFKNVPSYEVQSEDELNLVEILLTAGIEKSKRQAREDITNGAIYINGDRVQDVSYTLSDEDKLADAFVVVRRGKKKYFVLQF